MNAIQPPELAVAVAPDAGGAFRLVWRLSVFYGLAMSAVLLPLAASPAAPLAAEARSGGLAGIAAGSLLLALTGLLATLPMTWARRRVGMGLHAPQVLARMGRRPQGSIVPVLGLAAAAAAWWMRPAVPGAMANAVLLGSCAIVLSFPLLVAERIMAGVRPLRLPEAPGLHALLFVPVIAISAGGALEVAAGLGAWWARPAMTAIVAFLCIAAAELGVRSLANWFLPPPSPAAARAAVGSLAALALQPGRWAGGGLAAPLRTHLGLDFSRSWALRYVQSAALPVTLLIVLAGWGLSGVALINLDQRGIYERFGAPVAVWQPGAHAGLPWPLGRVRLIELGVVHSVALGGGDLAIAVTSAEELVPNAADRLWDRPHPAEVSYLIASVESSGAQSFQSVSVDLRVLYRMGLDDAAALRAAYAVAAPADLVRADAGRLLARFFAGQTLDAVLGDNREALAETLRAALQADLDGQGSGIQLAGLVIEAIHPPPEAAEAYHNVQAAEIVANTAIATERGRAQATAAMARQIATGLLNDAGAAAAETIGQAAVLSRSFAADRDAALAGGAAFLLERYFANVSLALARSPLVIVDHRLGGPDAPTIDLRSFGAPTGRPGDDD